MFFIKNTFNVFVLNMFIGLNLVFASEAHDDPIRTCETQGQEVNRVVTIGGQQKVRGDFANNQNLGDFSFSPGSHEEQLVSRTRLNMFLKPAEFFESFVEGQYYARQGDQDYSKMNLYQAYVVLSREQPLPISLKAGRQGFCYGSTFFLGENDFYDGLVWDGVKVNVAPREDLWIDFIAARYVKFNENNSSAEPALYGFYTSYNMKKDMDFDTYFFYHKGGFKFFHADLPDSPAWFTLGTRLAGKIKEQLDYEIEPLYQFGEIDNPGRGSRDTISAYGGHIEAGYTFKSQHHPRVFAGYAFGSGDKDSLDKKYQDFHGNVYNDNYVVGDTSLIPDLSGVAVGGSRASGMHIGLIGASADVLPRLNLNLDYHYFLADKAPTGISKKLGSEINFIATYKLLEDLSIILSANRFFTGDFFKGASGSGKDINYFYLQTQFEF